MPRILLVMGDAFRLQAERKSPNTLFYFYLFNYLFLPSGGGSVLFVHPRKYAPENSNHGKYGDNIFVSEERIYT